MSSRGAAALHSARYLVLLLFLTMPVWANLTRSGLPPTQIGPLPALNVQATAQGEISLSLARLVNVIGVDALASIKLSALIAILLLVTGVFAWARMLVGSRAGVLAAVIVVFAPVFLNMLFRDGDWALIWVMAGLAWAGFGLLALSWWGLMLAGVGMFVAVAAHPGLGLWALVGLMLLAVGSKRWLGIVALLVGGLVGLLLSTPWNVTAMPGTPTGAELYQLVEPGWLWGVKTLSLDTPLSTSLGFALLALLILAIWSHTRKSEVGNQEPAGAGDSMTDDDQVQIVQKQNQIADGEQEPESLALVVEDRETINSQQLTANSQLGRSIWLWHLAIGLGFVFFSLDFVAERIGFVSNTINDPWQLLLLALPFLAVAAVFVLHFLPQLEETPLWAGLLIIAILGAGPGLSPDFQTYDISASPELFDGDDRVLLLNLEVDGELEPGATIGINADWFSARPVGFDYNVFVHIDNGDGKSVAQLDTQPQAGDRPMTTWLPGEIISDRYELTVPTDVSPDLRLRLGLYNWQTGERMAVNGSDAVEWPEPE